jgi:hypothetical protein
MSPGSTATCRARMLDQAGSKDAGQCDECRDGRDATGLRRVIEQAKGIRWGDFRAPRHRCAISMARRKSPQVALSGDFHMTTDTRSGERDAGPWQEEPTKRDVMPRILAGS